jgi:RNA recognition motif-containing protein
MKQYFEQFGEIEQCVIMHDKPTGKSRGFGFIIFNCESSADYVMQFKNKHSIMGKWVDCKRAMPKELIKDGVSGGSKLQAKIDMSGVTNNGFNNVNNNMNSTYNNGNFYNPHSDSFYQNNKPNVNQNYVVNNYCK